jgi:hypothetical protein
VFPPLVGLTGRACVRCLISGFDGAVFSREWKEALWARFFTAAPQRLRRPVERCNIVKESLRTLASRYGINQKTVAKWKRRLGEGSRRVGAVRRCAEKPLPRRSPPPPAGGARAHWTEGGGAMRDGDRVPLPSRTHLERGRVGRSPRGPGSRISVSMVIAARQRLRPRHSPLL